MNKNLVIGILAAMLVLGSLWGQIGNRTKKAVQREQEEIIARLSQVEAETAKAHDALLAKTANLQKMLQVKEQQLAKARKELVGLRKGNKALEARISERDAAVAALTREKDNLAAQVTKLKLKQSLAVMENNSQQQVAELQAALQNKERKLAEKEQQLALKKQQLAAAAEEIEAIRAMKEESASAVDQSAQNTEELQAKLEKAETAVRKLQEQLAAVQASAQAAAQAAADQSRLAREYESVRAQVIGLEKIVEEKNAAIEETSKELDRWKVNMDVLLTRISEQEDSMQELREENQALVKELADKNRELADLNEQLVQTPVQQ
jgi:chromosome segregation ATPase